MKEQTILNMKHDLGKLAEAMHNTIRDLVGINTLTQGLLETVKRMPGYEEAIADLLESYQKDSDSKTKKLKL
jgi:GTP cyclohydrolase I